MPAQEETFALFAPETDGDGADFFGRVGEGAGGDGGFEEFEEGADAEDCGAAALGVLFVRQRGVKAGLWKLNGGMWRDVEGEGKGYGKRGSRGKHRTQESPYQLQLTLKSLNTRPAKLSPRGRHLRIRHMIINELSEMGDPARDQDAVDFRQDLGPGDGDGGLHVAHVD